MKTLTLLGVALQVACLPARSQVHLNAGDTYTFEFSSLPFTGTFIQVDTGASVSLQSFSLEPGSQVRLEMFENSVQEAPICAALITASPALFQRCYVPFAWQDLQGVVRFTGVSASSTLDGFTVVADRVVPAGVNVYSEAVQPVPEPGTLTLLGSAAGIFLDWMVRGRKSQHEGNASKRA